MFLVNGLREARQSVCSPLISALVALSLSVSVGAKAERPSHYGLTLPYPSKVPELITTTNLPYYRLEQVVPMILDVDKKGWVTAVTPTDSSGIAFVRYAETWIKSFRFEPARWKGKKVGSRLPVYLQFRPRVRLPEIHFPIDSNRMITDADLYFKAFDLNDIHPPRLEEFPPYFCELKWTDSLVIYKYVLVKVELDDSGQVVNTELVRSTFPAYSTPIMSAILWADFSPAEVHGTPIASECYLLVSFFPFLNYPTQVWRRTESDSLSLLERFRVRLLPDTVGLLTKPLPSWPAGDRFTYSGLRRRLRDTVSAMLYIDTSGHLRFGRMSGGSKELQAAVREMGAHLRFFPALDFQGQFHPYSGLVTFVSQSSARIRIVCHWLHSDSFTGLE